MDAWEVWQESLFERVTPLRSPDFVLDSLTRERLSLVVIDNIAAMISAASEPAVVELSAQRVSRTCLPEATTITGHHIDAQSAAFVNAIAGGWNEVDEGYRPATCHAGLYTLPVVMAEVERQQGRVADVFRGLLAGYEVATAYARAFSPPKPYRLHPHATLSTIGAATGLSIVAQGDVPCVREVVPVAASMAMIGTFAHAPRGLLMRNGWAGQAAVGGFTAMDFASVGLLSDVHEVRRLFEDVLGFPMNDEEIASEREAWAILDGYHKPYACCQYIHSAVEAALALTADSACGIRPDFVERVIVRTHPLALNLDNTNPTTDLGAKFSVPHCVASVLTFGSTEPATFSSTYLDHPDIRRIRSQVHMELFDDVGPPPHDRPAEVTVELIDGMTFRSVCMSARGGPDRPLDRGEILHKAKSLTIDSRPNFIEAATALLEGRIVGSDSWSDFLQTAGLRNSS